MALGKQVVSQVAEVLGIPRAATENCLELGQKAGLIRIGRRGGGRGGVHLNPSELVGLVMGHGVEPRASLGQLVPTYRALHPYAASGWMTDPALPSHMRLLRGGCFGEAGIELDAFRDLVDDLPKQIVSNKLLGDVWSGDGDPRCYRALPGETLGEALDLFVDVLSYPMAVRLRTAIRKADWSFSMVSTERAHISFMDETSDNHTGSVRFKSYYQPENYLPSKPPGMIRLTEFNFEVFEVLADLWADSRAHLGIDSFPSFPSSPAPAVPNAGQENESAGGVPTPPAPSRDPNRAQPHGSRTLASLEDMEGREKSQPSAARGRVAPGGSRAVPTTFSRRPRRHVPPDDPAHVFAA